MPRIVPAWGGDRVGAVFAGVTACGPEDETSSDDVTLEMVTVAGRAGAPSEFFGIGNAVGTTSPAGWAERRGGQVPPTWSTPALADILEEVHRVVGGIVTKCIGGGQASAEVTEGVAHLHLNRPDAANAFDLPTSRAFGAAVNRAAEDPEVRAILLTGAGARFCAGGDVSSIEAADDPPMYLHELALDLDDALQRLAAMPKPIVAAVHGAVAGAGLAVMLSCDVVVAAEGTKFVFAYPGIGLTPDCGVSWLLPRAIGQQRALAFALGARPVTADVALD